MKSVTKWLTDPDADDYPFPHKIGERLRSQAKNLEGIVRNAKFAGTEDGESALITYYIETDNGEIIQLPWFELGIRYEILGYNISCCNNHRVNQLDYHNIFQLSRQG